MTDRKQRPPSLAAVHADLDEYTDDSAGNLDLIRRRQAHFGGSMLFYHDPVNIVKGEGVWLFDQHGRKYLDCYNNVASVGHCNPRVVEAITQQAAKLNTHTRYLHETVVDYAEQLASTFPGDLEVCLFVCSGTEANELAMRIARAVTRNTGAVVMEYSYHGNSTLISEMSTMGSRAEDRADHVVAIEPPNTYRGLYQPGDETPGESIGQKYAGLVDPAIALLDERGLGIAAFMCDTMFDSQGGLEAPTDYFENVYQKIREAGGLCIADEVQPGFVRTGKMWGFEHYGVVPDIVTLGKPMGNGHPIAGVVTTHEIMERFSESAFYFNTFGGNPVSSAAGMAVLNEIQSRDMTTHVEKSGHYLRRQLEQLSKKHDIIGNVHGLGLYQALDLVLDKSSQTPAAELASKIPDAMKDAGVLIGLSGRHGNVLKIRPPLVFDTDNADQLVEALDRVLGVFSNMK